MVAKPLLVMFLGVPGSGKSYFARQLAAKTNAVRLNGDSMRIALYGSVEEVIKHADDPMINPMTFQAIDYAVGQVLTAGHSVIYDAHHNKRSIREKLEAVAQEHDAIPIVVWIKTPHELAIKRGQEREARADQRVNSETQMRQSVARHMANFDKPGSNENVIEISGESPFDEQFVAFERAVKVITALVMADESRQ